MIRDRVTELRRVPARQLKANPKNWRTHPESQRAALAGILEQVGMVDAVKAIETPDGLVIIDGHLRSDIADDSPIPVLVVDLTPEEADLVLASFDPLSAMAEADGEQLASLLANIATDSEALAAMLDGLSEAAGMFSIDESDAPELQTGDREPYQQMTFTLHDSQAETVKEAIESAKASGHFDDSQNENSNGNALARIAEAYCGTS